MRFHRALAITPLFLTLIAASFVDSGTARAGDDYGSISGQFVLKGEVPEPKLLHKKGAVVRDPSVCAAKDTLDDSLVIDAKSKGIANVFVYIRKVDKIHPDLVDPPAKVLTFDQKGCQYQPHAMFVRTGQTVLVKSSDACSHNTHTYPLRNKAENFVIAPGNQAGIPLKHPIPELLPIKVGCDIHPWMQSWWLILDHPYVAVTNAKGEFAIEKLPVGTYEFRVWHEKAGYVGVGTKRGFEVTVIGGKMETMKAFEVDLAEFEE